MKVRIDVGVCDRCGAEGLPGGGNYLHRYTSPPRYEEAGRSRALATAVIGDKWLCGACATAVHRSRGVLQRLVGSGPL